MKKQLLLLTLLVLPLLGIHAFTGTLTRWDAKMQYSIEGGTVTKKTKPVSSNMNNVDCTVLVEGTVKPGSTLNASIKKLAGITLPKERIGNLNKVMIQYQIYTDPGVKPISKKVEHATATSLSIPVPANASKVYVTLTYFTPHNRLICESTWEVNGTTTTNSTSTTSFSGGRDERYKYTVSGGHVKEHVNTRGYHSYGGNISHGESISVSVTSSMPYGTEVHIVYEFRDKNNKIISPSGRKYAFDKEITTSVVVPTNAVKAHLSIDIRNGEEQVDVDYQCNPATTSTTPTAGNFNWNDVAEDHVCGCKGQFSNQYVTHVTGHPKKACSKSTTPTRYEDLDLRKPVYIYERVFVKDCFWTDAKSKFDIQWGDDAESTISVHPNSLVMFEGFVNGRARWKVYKGTITGENLKKVADRLTKPQFYLSNCMASLFGTTYVIQDDGKTSTIYLLDGSIEVTNNAKKTYKLKPGEVSTVAKDGKISVKKFDVKAMARKYGLGTSTTTTTTTNEKHYALQRASVKYKYTKGSQTGEVVRRFDGYGAYERVDSKVGTTINVTICRGAKSYRLDVATKTAHESAYAPIFFLKEADVKKHGLTKKGTATVAGKPCTVYASAKEEYYVWNGITLKRIVNEGGTKTIVEAYAVEQPATMDESLFKLPQGYQVK